MADDYLSQLLAANPDLAAGLMGGGAPAAAPAQGADLQALIAQSARSVTPYNPALAGLPLWAQGLSSDILGNSDFSPYLGVVSQQGDERVYWGQGHRDFLVEGQAPNKFASDMGGPPPIDHEAKPGDKTRSVNQAMNMPYTWDSDEVKSAMGKLRDAGIQVNTFDDLISAWGGLVNRAAMTYAMSDGKRKVTPWDVLDLYKDEAQSSGLLDKLNGTKTTVSRNVTDIDEGEAWATIQSNLSGLLGRDPSDQETRDFTYRMGQLAARNPSVSKTTTTYKDGEATGSSTHTTPGFTNADMAHEAYDNAQADPEYAEYRSASTYFNALQSALGPIGG